MVASQLTRRPHVHATLFREALADRDAAERARIPAEKIRGPVLLVSGSEDQLWPSAEMGEMVVARLRICGHPYRYRHLVYDGAGHAIGLPGQPPSAYPTEVAHPVTRCLYALGGTRRKNAEAAGDAWGQVVQFLQEALKC